MPDLVGGDGALNLPGRSSRHEEAVMHQQFGPAYSDCQHRIRRFIPRRR
jgi:protein-S-isoprenylcysteine O-methyltransferase Ste14